MLLSYNWLRELTATRLSPEELRERLTNVGLAVDAVEQRGDDFVLDAEVSSNRGDCLSHVGIAREIAVIEESKVQSPKSEVQNTSGKTSDLTSVLIDDPDLCPRYAARVVRGARISPSPDWLTRKLEAIGQRPINNVADITNYVLHELGQPLHAFDLAKLEERRIVVRRARRGEKIKTLDGVERNLDEQMLVIADASRAVAVAGVMGGEDSEISSATTDILIESAYFNASSVRRTAKLLGLNTEASHRFERGIDPEGVIGAQSRCVALICELAGGTATEDALDVYPRPFQAGDVILRPARVEAITSLQVETEEMLRILTALGFKLQEQDGPALRFTVPSWRHDVAIEEDLVEEVARHTGYDQIQTALPAASSAGEYHATEARKRALRLSLAAHGYDEAISFSFIERTNDFDLLPALKTAADESSVVLTNPIIEEASQMRQTLLAGLLKALQHNINQGNRNLCLFESGRVFAAQEQKELPAEREALAMVATGGLMLAGRAQPDRELDFFDLKGAFEAAVEAMKLPPLEFRAAEIKHLRPGQSAVVCSHGAPVGSIGRLSESAAGEYKFRQPVFVAEIDLTALLESAELPVLYSPLPRFPAIVRDVSLLVARNLSVAELIRAVAEQKPGHFVRTEFLGTYEGEGIADDKRSVTIRIEYRADDRTLRDEEVDEIHWPVIEVLKQKFNAEVR
ncbi:MAG TPA: phenylalanine--tRNA ligase subunit beta [Pyrinomonadaceae bacterium]|nr:phenylalanine--tRNA ligase subunit beta [Pyrinomonadaceae bacterium]